MNRGQISESGKILSKIFLLPLSAKIAIAIIFCFLTLAIVIYGRQVVIHHIFPAFSIDIGKSGVLKQSVKKPGQSDLDRENESTLLYPLLQNKSAPTEVRVDHYPFFGDEYDLDPFGNH